MTEAHSLQPVLGADETPAETEAEYVERVGHLLPNAPADVLGQWFFDHWLQIGDWNHLDLPHVRFTLASWPTQTLLEQSLGDGEGTEERVHYIATSTDLATSYQRLLDYFEEHGTWPRPLIVFDTRSPFPWLPGWMERGSYQLVEGHRRFAMLRAAAARKIPQRRDHQLWIATYSSAS